MKQQICKWYDLCPLKRYYEQGKLNKKWVEGYCWVNRPDCVRKKLEEKGIFHPDNLLPDGTVDRDLEGV